MHRALRYFVVKVTRVCYPTEIDECSVPSTCHVNGTCINTPGSFVCQCNSGFSGDGFHCNGRYPGLPVTWMARVSTHLGHLCAKVTAGSLELKTINYLTSLHVKHVLYAKLAPNQIALYRPSFIANETCLFYIF